MKRFFNVCAILFAICLAASFVSCKNDDDDDSSVVASDSSSVAGDPSGVAGDSSAVYTRSGGNVTDTWTFYDDKTVTNVVVYEGRTDSYTKTGTWTGSLSGMGTITLENGISYDFSVSGNIMTISNYGGFNSNEYTKLQ